MDMIPWYKKLIQPLSDFPPMVEFQQSSKSFPANDWSVARERIGRLLREQQQVLFALVWSFMEAMTPDELSDGVPQRCFTEEDYPVEALRFYGFH